MVFFLGCGSEMKWRQFGKGAQSITGQMQGRSNSAGRFSRDSRASLWRDESLGQPLFLDTPQTNMLALFKALRLKISTFQGNSHYRIEGRPLLISLRKA